MGFWLFGFVLPIFSAEMCAGSLESGCQFAKQFAFPKQTVVVIFYAQDCDLGGLVCLHVGNLGGHFGTSGAPWGLESRDFVGHRGLQFCLFVGFVSSSGFSSDSFPQGLNSGDIIMHFHVNKMLSRTFLFVFWCL